MDIIDTFMRFAEDFEATIEDDDWSRLENYFSKDATYLNVGGPDPKVEGREAILDYLKSDVANSDRRFDTRTLTALTPPTATGNRLSRRWRCTYTCAGAPDLAIEGEARYVFEGDLIKAIEEEVTAQSMRDFEQWMQTHGHRLQD